MILSSRLRCDRSGLSRFSFLRGGNSSPEKDDRDKEIDRLREELNSYKQTSPDISVTFLNVDGEETTTIEAVVEVFEPSGGAIERAVASVQASFPIEEDFRRSPGAAIGPWAYIAPFGRGRRGPAARRGDRGLQDRSLSATAGVRPQDAAPPRRTTKRDSHEIPFSLRVCAVKRRRFPVGASPTRRPLQPEATGAGMEVTKCLKPSDSGSRNTVTARVCRPQRE